MIKSIYIILLMIFSLKISAQNWDLYTSSNTGLPSDNVLSMAEDSLGTIWFGTRNGLSKYDGISWTNYRISNDVISELIYSLAIDKYGNKWMGTNFGLVKFNDKYFTIYNRANSDLPSDTVSVIQIDKNGNKWLGLAPRYNRYRGYDDAGVVMFDDSTWTRYTTYNSTLPSNYITAIAIEDKGTIWVGTKEGLASFDHSTWTNYSTENSSLPSGPISAISIDNDNKKWIGCSNNSLDLDHCYQGQGLGMFDDKNWYMFNANNSGLPANEIYSINVDQSNIKWIGTTEGMVKYNNETWTFYNTSNSELPDRHVKSILIDHEDHKWASIITDERDIQYYVGTGVVEMNDQGFKLYSHATTGLPKETYYTTWINAITIDKLGNKWLGNYGSGLSMFNDTIWVNYFRESSGLPSDTINAIQIDTSGNLWIATFNGLSKYDGTSWTNYNESNSGLPSNIVYDIEIDNTGRKWLATWEDLAVLDDENWLTYNIKKVSSICIDSFGNKWFGTSGNGLYKFDGNSWTNYTVFNSGLASNWIWDVTCDKNGNIWIGTWTKGLNKFNGSNWITFNTTNSMLPDNNVKAILIDEFDSKWIGTDNGFSQFNEGEWINYFNKDVLKYTDVFSISKDELGNVWLGTTEGLLKFSEYISLGSNSTRSLRVKKLSHVFPNPTSGMFEISNIIPNTEIKIFNTAGKICKYQITTSKSIVVDASRLPNGIYFVKTYSEYGAVTEKIIKRE